MNCCIFTSLCFNRFFFRIEYYVLVICQRENVYYLFNSPKPWRVLSPSFLILSSSSAFCLLVLFTPFYLDQTFPKSVPNLSARLSLAWLGSAWLSATQCDSAQLSVTQLHSAGFSQTQCDSIVPKISILPASIYLIRGDICSNTI